MPAPLSWKCAKFKLVADISNLLGSDNVKYNVLGEGMKEMLGIAGDPSLHLPLLQATPSLPKKALGTFST